MVATNMRGHLSFQRPDVAITDKLTSGHGEFADKFPKCAPTKIMLHPDNQTHMEAIQAWIEEQRLKLEVVFTNSVLPNHIWWGMPKAGGAPAVRAVASKARVLAAADVDAPVVQQVIVAVPECEEEIEVDITPGWIAAMQSYFQVTRVALPAPKIAGLLCAVNPRGDEVGAVDSGEDEHIPQFAPMVLNRDWVEAWKVAHSSSEASRPALLSLVKDGTPEVRVPDPAWQPKRHEEEPVLVNLPERMRRDRIYMMWARQRIDNSPRVAVLELPPPAPRIQQPALVLTKEEEEFIASLPPRPQDVTMHPRDVMAEIAALADAKSEPKVLSAEARLEQAAMDRAEVSPAFLDDFMQALEYAVEHQDNREARLLVDGHRIQVHPRMNKVTVWHPIIGDVSEMIASRLKGEDAFRFVARRHEIRAYLVKCGQEFEKRKITPIKAGEKYDWEQKYVNGKKVA